MEFFTCIKTHIQRYQQLVILTNTGWKKRPKLSTYYKYIYTKGTDLTSVAYLSEDVISTGLFGKFISIVSPAIYKMNVTLTHIFSVHTQNSAAHKSSR